MKAKKRKNGCHQGIFLEGGSTHEFNILTSNKDFLIYEDTKSHMGKIKAGSRTGSYLPSYE